MTNLDQEIRMAISTGRVYLGSKITLSEISRGRAKMALISSNCPENIEKNIINYGNLSNIPVLKHQKDSIDLGVLCGKPFPVSAIVINDPGDSKILEMEG